MPNQSKPDVVFRLGGQCEFSEWRIEYDYRVEGHSDLLPCPHCVVDEPGSPNSLRWTCPLVVTTSNEGGHNGTAICLSCILEKAPPHVSVRQEKDFRRMILDAPPIDDEELAEIWNTFQENVSKFVKVLGTPTAVAAEALRKLCVNTDNVDD